MFTWDGGEPFFLAVVFLAVVVLATAFLAALALAAALAAALLAAVASAAACVQPLSWRRWPWRLSGSSIAHLILPGYTTGL